MGEFIHVLDLRCTGLESQVHALRSQLEATTGDVVKLSEGRYHPYSHEGKGKGRERRRRGDSGSSSGGEAEWDTSGWGMGYPEYLGSP